MQSITDERSAEGKFAHLQLVPKHSWMSFIRRDHSTVSASILLMTIIFALLACVATSISAIPELIDDNEKGNTR